MRRFTKVEDKELARLYRQYIKVSEIAERFQRPPVSIYKRVELLELKRGQARVVTIKNSNRSPEVKIKAMYKLGLSLRTIAREFNLSHEWVRQIIKGRTHHD